MNQRSLILKKDLLTAFQQAGLTKGDNIIVHTSLSSLGFVCGGPQIVIEALLETVGPEGTILMPTQSWKNLDPTAGVHWEEPQEWWQAIRDNWPAYDPAITPTNTMGAVAEMFRTYPGTIRSSHPARSFAANGKNAQYLIQDHDLEDIFGEQSPIGKLYQLNGKVLLIGVGYDKNTSLHLADVRATYPSKTYGSESSAMMVDGKRQWVTYNTLTVDGEDFEQIGKAFENEYQVTKVPISNTTIRSMNQRQLVDFAVKWIEQNRN